MHPSIYVYPYIGSRTLLNEYLSIEKFVREHMLQNELPLNNLKTTKSAIKPIVEGFQARHWYVEDVTPEGEKTKRHRLVSPDGETSLKMTTAKVFKHPPTTEIICKRKHLTKRMLDFAGIPTPGGADFALEDKEVAKAFFNLLPKPTVVKPTNSGGSHGVTVGVTNVEEFEHAWDIAASEAEPNSHILLEQFVKGVELHAFVLGNEVASLVARVQPFVVGNGTDSLDSLIEASIEARNKHYRAKQLGLVVDWDFINKQGYSDGTAIPAAEEIVFVNPFGLPVSGAYLVEVSDVVHPKILEIAINARKAIPDLETAGVDLLVSDISDPETAVVLEINTSPSINLHRYTTHGQMREVTQDIVRYFTNSVEQQTPNLDSSNNISSSLLLAPTSNIDKIERNGMADSSVIHFKNLEVGKNRVDVVIEEAQQEHSLFFEFDRAIEPSSQEIAHALSTLCGKKYSHIEFDFEVPSNTVEHIAKFTGAEVNAVHSAPVENSEFTDGNILSFSGGFDSMAAKALMPDDTHLVSLDFGGWFTREAEFFKKFAPITITTNARRIPDQPTSFARNHWGFMAIGAILTRSYLGARYHTFGNILGTEFQSAGPSRVKLAPLENLGFIDAPYTNGITELGTAKLMTLAYPDLLGDSIESLAGKRDRKRFLKIALIHAVTSDSKILESIPPAEHEWNSPVSFESSYTTSLGALALYSQDKGHLIEPIFDQVPEASINFARSHDFSFMQKINWDKHQHMEPVLMGDFWTKLSKFGFTPYTEKDWKSVSAVRSHLNNVFKKG